MSYILSRLVRMLRRPPVILFLVLVLGSCLVGYGVLYLTLSANLDGEYFHVKNEYLEMEFPRNWYAWSSGGGNETIGKGYSAYLGPTDRYVVMKIVVYDEKLTQTFMKENDLTDTFSVVIFEANLLYEISRAQFNENATLSFVKNDTASVMNRQADYTEITIQNGIVKNDLLTDMAGIIFSYKFQQRLFQISFWGEEKDWIQTYDTFEVILNSINTGGL